MASRHSNSIYRYLSLFFFFSILNKQIQAAVTDSFSAYFTGGATALDVEHTTNNIVFATDAYEIKQYNALTKALVTTITTSHRAQINAISISSDASMALTGGRDFIAELYDLASGSLICQWT